MSQGTMLLTPYVQSAAPCVAVNTHEEARFAKAVVKAFQHHHVFGISVTGGLKDLKTGAVVDAQANYLKAIETIAQRTDTLLLVFDLQYMLHNAPMYRGLKDKLPALKSKGAMVVLVAPQWKLPEELKVDVPVLEWELPTRPELDSALQAVAKSTQQKIPEADRPALLDAAAGLALEQAENAFSLAYVDRGRFDPDRVADEKMRMVKTEGLLEIWRPISLNQVGGLSMFKDYLLQEVVPWKDDVQLRTRGILMVGVPGTGKSLSMKATGAALGWPVLRMDVASLKGSLVGQSEANMRKALKTASAVAPCILGMDELEKGIGGFASSAVTDSGVTLGMLGTLLTWMQENTAPVLVVGTCNDYAKLPPELTRRFDSSWFMDLPKPAERKEIAEIHLLAIKCQYTPATLQEIVNRTDKFTGDEVRNLILSVARRSRRNPDAAIITEVAQSMKPIAVSRAADIDRLRSWAQESIRLANNPEEAPTTARRMRRAASAAESEE